MIETENLPEVLAFCLGLHRLELPPGISSSRFKVRLRAGKNLRFFKNVFRFLGFLGFFRFLGFNVYAQSHAKYWTQEYDELKSYHVGLRIQTNSCTSMLNVINPMNS